MSIEKLQKLFKKRKQDINKGENEYNRIISKKPELAFEMLPEKTHFDILCKAIESKDFNNLLLLEKLHFDFSKYSFKFKADVCYKKSATFDNWEQYFSFFTLQIRKASSFKAGI